MLPLSAPPKTFRDIVEADLRRAARLIIKVQDDIDWQFRIATPDGDIHLAITMPDGEARTEMLQRLSVFMAWKRALAFTLGVETRDPDAVYAIGIAAHERYACMARITRTPKPWTAANFGPVEWLPADSIDPVLAKLLPTKPRAMTPKDIHGLQAWFGTDGTFPAVHIPSGELRGV
jgi:hypothetical protein